MLAHVRITLIEERLKLSSFGKVTRVLLRRYRSEAAVGRENPESEVEILRPAGVLETTVLMKDFRALKLVVSCYDTPKFSPCAGGDIIFDVKQTEANQALLPTPTAVTPRAGHESRQP